MSRAIWWFLVVAVLAFTVWNAMSLKMFDVSMSCAKVGEGGSYQCGDRALDVLGVWPLIIVGLLLATPPVAAAIAMRRRVSLLAAAALVGLSIVGVLLTTDSSYWTLLVFALPMAARGSIAAARQPSAPHSKTRGLGSTASVASV